MLITHKPLPNKRRICYPLNQCALYRTGSKRKLEERLGFPIDHLVRLAKGTDNYKIFELPEEICPFTNKVKKARWVQEPKVNLRKVHERIQKLLKFVVTPEYAHASIKHRSYRSNALAHQNGIEAATFDVRKFYPSTAPSRIFNFFHDQLLCAPDVAELLTKICSYGNGLPTGSPLSPLLSLFANKPMFDELDALAKSRNLIFTCYMDDVTFSGDIVAADIEYLVRKIVNNNGHKLANEKTKFFKQDDAKHITGVVIYRQALAVPHSRFLKARAIKAAIVNADSVGEKAKLTRKLAGLLGEAAYLDGQYRGWAVRTNAELKVLDSTLIKSTEEKINRQENKAMAASQNQSLSNPPW